MATMGQRFAAMMEFMNDAEIIRGGVNEVLEKYCMEEYELEKEEMENIVLAIYAIAHNRKIKEIE